MSTMTESELRGQIEGKGQAEALKIIGDAMIAGADAAACSKLIDEVLGTRIDDEDAELGEEWERRRR